MQFFFVSNNINHSHFLIGYCWQYRFVIISSPGHFQDQFGMSGFNRLKFHQSIFNESLYTSSLLDGTNQHMQFDMLTKKMFSTHFCRIYQPHSHISYNIKYELLCQISTRSVENNMVISLFTS